MANTNTFQATTCPMFETILPPDRSIPTFMPVTQFHAMTQEGRKTTIAATSHTTETSYRSIH